MASGSLLLKPENARYSDLFTILFSPNLKGRKLVESSEVAKGESAEKLLLKKKKKSKLVESSCGTEKLLLEKDSKLAEISGDAEGEGAVEIKSIPEQGDYLTCGELVEISGDAEGEDAEEITSIPEQVKCFTWSELVEISGDAEGEGAEEITSIPEQVKCLPCGELAEISGNAEGEGDEEITSILDQVDYLPCGELVEVSGDAEGEDAEENTSITEQVYYTCSEFAEISGDAEDEGAEKTSVSRKDSLKGIYSSILRELVIRFSLWLQVFLRLFGAKVLNGIERCLNSGGQENDERVLKFDTDIKSHDDRKYNAALTAMACEASYKTIDCIKTAIKSNPEMEFVGSHGFSEDISRCTIDAFVFQDKRTNTYALVFRGTESFNAYEWCADFDVSYVPFVDHDGKFQGKVHHGFWNLLEESKEKAYNDIRNILKEALKDIKKGKLIITGHSLGGALAILFTAKLLSHSETDLLERLDEVHNFGQPRVGNEEFSHYMEQELSHRNIVYYRVVYHIDMVPRMPFDFDDGWFTHIAPSVQYDRKNNYQIFKQLPNKNYFSLLMAIPMRLSALFELIMSFTNGSETRKNLRSMILVLVSPGIVAHFVANYANATRESFPRAYELTDPKDSPPINFLFIISYIFIFFLFLIF